MVLEKTLESLMDTRRSNQSILKAINPEYSLEGLRLKLQYSGHVIQRTDSLEKTLMLGKIGGRRRRGQQRMRWLYGTTNSTDTNVGKFWEMVRCQQRSLVSCSPWGHRESDMTEELDDNNLLKYFSVQIS